MSVPNDRISCYYSHEGRERECDRFDVLTGERRGSYWKGTKDGNIPPCTVLSSKENGFGIGRSFMRGEVVVGKIDAENGVLYAPYGRKEYNFTEYDALIEMREQCWVQRKYWTVTFISW